METKARKMSLHFLLKALQAEEERGELFVSGGAEGVAEEPEGAGSERADARGISRASPSGGWASQQRRDIRSA